MKITSILFLAALNNYFGFSTDLCYNWSPMGIYISFKSAIFASTNPRHIRL